MHSLSTKRDQSLTFDSKVALVVLLVDALPELTMVDRPPPFIEDMSPIFHSQCSIIGSIGPFSRKTFSEWGSSQSLFSRRNFSWNKNKGNLLAISFVPTFSRSESHLRESSYMMTLKIPDGNQVQENDRQKRRAKQT